MKKRMTSYNFYCCVEGCEKIRNGQSQYCAEHQAKYSYEKSEHKLTGKEWQKYWFWLKKEAKKWE